MITRSTINPNRNAVKHQIINELPLLCVGTCLMLHVRKYKVIPLFSRKVFTDIFLSNDLNLKTNIFIEKNIILLFLTLY